MNEEFDDFEEDLEQLEEVEVLDGEQPIEEDDTLDEYVADEENIEVTQITEDISDLSFFSFQEHQDAVYCAAFHPTIDGLVVTGESTAG